MNPLLEHGEHAADYDAQHVTLLGICPDSLPALRAWAEQERLAVALASDPGGAVSQAYQIGPAGGMVLLSPAGRVLLRGEPVPPPETVLAALAGK